MQYRHRLRSRIILSFVLLGFGLTATFAVATLSLRNRFENQLIEDTLQREVDSMVEQARHNPGQPYPFSFYEAWSFSARTAYRVPLSWQPLQTGVHEITEVDEQGRERHYKLAVRRDDDVMGYIRYEISRAVLGQQQLIILLGVTVVAFTGLAFLVGLWSSRRVMRPVSDLARRVRGFQTGETPQPLAPKFPNDEVGELAAALDDYAAQLTERVRRDREFNADVSHELRTPLAVIRGASELLLTQPDLSDRMRQRLLRIERAAQQSSDLTTALLMLSRHERGSGRTELAKLLDHLVEANRAQVAGKPVEVRLEIECDAVVLAPEAVLAVAVGNLIGNACKYTAEGEVVVRLLADRVIIQDSGPGISVEDAERLFERGYRGSSAGNSKGAGIGLAIVRRLCDLYGWRVSMAPGEQVGAVATLVFPETGTIGATEVARSAGGKTVSPQTT